jgi:cytochrome P450
MSQPEHAPARFRLRELRADLLGAQRELAARHHGFARYQVLRREFTLVAGAEASQRLFVSNSAAYARSLQHENLALILGNGLICSDGDDWRRQRKLAQPAFGQALLARVAEITTRLMSELLITWEQAAAPVEVAGAMQTLAMRVIGLALFSRDLGEGPTDFAAAARTAVQVIGLRNISPVTLPLWFPLPVHRRFRRYLSAVDQFIGDRIEERLAGAGGYDDILASLIRCYGSQAGQCRRELRDQVVTLFFAGFETTATALTWTWLLLSQHPAAEARLHQELDRVLGGRIPAYTDLAALTYTRQVIQESLRLYPPVYTVTRRAVADDEVGGHRIRRGDNVVIPVHALHRMPAYWDSPEEFCPERFDAGRLTRIQRQAYAPFSQGQRKCMGANLATTELAAALATACQRVRLRLVAGHPVETAAAVTQQPRHGLLMHVESRDRP